MIAVQGADIKQKNTLFVKRFDASNIDDVVDNAFLEADCPVIIHMGDGIWSFIFHGMFEILPCFDKDLITNVVSMIASCAILTKIVGIHDFLTAGADMVPTCRMVNILNSIMTKD